MEKHHQKQIKELFMSVIKQATKKVKTSSLISENLEVKKVGAHHAVLRSANCAREFNNRLENRLEIGK